MVFACCKVLICLYFMLSKSKEWRYMAICSILLASISLFFTITYMPESPRYLLSKKKFTEANFVFKNILRINKKFEKS